MKKTCIAFLSLVLAFTGAFAGDYQTFNGKTVKEINVKTVRIKPDIVKAKFPVKEGEVFLPDNFDFAKQTLHDMRIFKEINFAVEDNYDGTISINIDAKDANYVFPMIFGSGGSKSTLAIALIEANCFKRGETALIFGLYSTDGYMAMGGFGINNNFFNASFGKLDYKEKVFDNGSYNSSGFFSSSGNLHQFSAPVNKYEIEADTAGLEWSRTILEKMSFSIGFNYSDIKYSGNDAPKDEGNHNTFTIGLKKFKNGNPGATGSNFGAVFGVGLSDVKDKLADLSENRYGYFAGLDYANGGTLTGADYNISKLYLKTKGNIEFKNRNILNIDISGAAAFEAPFFDRIRSNEVLSGQGVYSREFRGEEAVGIGASFVYFLLKNTLGIATLVPFAESSVVWDKGYRHSLTGVGASISYRFWRVPFPLGINYTHNIVDGSYNISFIFGG